MSGYMDRALRAKDPRFARALEKMGYQRRDMVASAPVADKPEEDGLTDLRTEYQEVIGKKAYHGWNAETLREKIAEAKAEG